MVFSLKVSLVLLIWLEAFSLVDMELLWVVNIRWSVGKPFMSSLFQGSPITEYFRERSNKLARSEKCCCAFLIV